MSRRNDAQASPDHSVPMPRHVVCTSGINENGSCEIIADLEHGKGAPDSSPYQCKICLDDIGATHRTLTHAWCTSTFHESCLEEWLSNHDTCPICRDTNEHTRLLPRGTSPEVARTCPSVLGVRRPQGEQYQEEGRFVEEEPWLEEEQFPEEAVRLQEELWMQEELGPDEQEDDEDLDDDHNDNEDLEDEEELQELQMRLAIKRSIQDQANELPARSQPVFPFTDRVANERRNPFRDSVHEDLDAILDALNLGPDRR